MIGTEKRESPVMSFGEHKGKSLTSTFRRHRLRNPPTMLALRRWGMHGMVRTDACRLSVSRAGACCSTNKPWRMLSARPSSISARPAPVEKSTESEGLMSESFRSGIRRHDKQNPCPICRHDHGCATTADGLIFCLRSHGDIPGYLCLGEARDGMGGLYREVGDTRGMRLAGDPRPAPRAKAPRRETDEDRLDPVEIEQILARARRRSDHKERIAELAHERGVKAESLHALGYLWGPRVPTGVRVYDPRTEIWEPEYRDLHVYAYPLIGVDGEPCGIATLSQDGRKRMIYGSQLGIAEPWGWWERAESIGTIYAPEGAGDVSALWSMGLAAVGRPSNRAGAETLAERLRPLVEAGVRIVIVADRDEHGAGIDGARHTARIVADKLGIAVEVAYPPVKCKDSRAWLIQQAVALENAAALTEAGQRYEHGLEKVEIVAPAAAEPLANTPAEEPTAEPQVLTYCTQPRQPVLVQKKNASSAKSVGEYRFG